MGTGAFGAESRAERDAFAPARVITALSELAAQVQRGRTPDAVLQTAGTGVLALGMRLVAFQIADDKLVLRYVATSAQRVRALERQLGRCLHGMSAPIGPWPFVRELIDGRQTVYRPDLDLFDQFLKKSAGYDATHLDAVPETAGITNGVVAPLFVRDAPWGILAVISQRLTPVDREAVKLFATHVASALEVAESIETLERVNREMASVNAHLASTQRELVKRERLAALGELSAVVAHEVRNPIAVLFNSIAALRRTLDAPDADAARADVDALLAIMNEEADRLKGIVSDLLEFARPDRPSFQPGSLRRVIEEAIAAAANEPQAAGIEVCVEAPVDLPNVDIDTRSMRQAILNVLLNGLQATPNRGRLIVRASVEQTSRSGFARVDVVDTGPGIPHELRSRIFEPFFTTKATGTGLGLAIVKRILDAHHGEVSVESSSEGTTFTLRLPLDGAGRLAGPPS